ncbi:MAG TPA: ABC transporter permease [Kofleriaceae bacterium]|nr:ABC transporter permease [Kofleriaceae bacterium]
MIRIALSSLFFERGKLLAALSGVAFAANLVLVQMGLFFGFQQASTAVISRAGGDLWVMARGTQLVDFADPLSPGVGEQIRAVPCVERARPVIFSWASIRKPSGGIDNVQLIAAEPAPGRALPWALAEGLPADLRAPKRIAVDEADLDRLEIPRPAIGQQVELQDGPVYIGAVTKGIRSFTVVPYLFAEPREARRILGLVEGQATFWAVDLADTRCAPDVRAAIERHPDLVVRDRRQFEKMTSHYWVIGSGAGATLAFAALLGLIVGLVVVGQTLYSLTESRSRELATLKAMGASGRELAAFVLWQAGLLAVSGGLVGLVWAFGLARLVQTVGLTVVLDATVIGGGLGTIVGMCALASLASVRKVVRLEAAKVFK